MKRSAITFLSMVLSAASVCRAAEPVKGAEPSLPIIKLVTQNADASSERHVMLQLDYGVIISNADTNLAPGYYLFCRDDRRILKTQDVNVFLAELEKLPDGTTIDKIAKCTVPFCTQWGVDIEKELVRINALYTKKKFSLFFGLRLLNRDILALIYPLCNPFLGNTRFSFDHSAQGLASILQWKTSKEP